MPHPRLEYGDSKILYRAPCSPGSDASDWWGIQGPFCPLRTWNLWTLSLLHIYSIFPFDSSLGHENWNSHFNHFCHLLLVSTGTYMDIHLFTHVEQTTEPDGVY
jgi:hypothetical protein